MQEWGHRVAEQADAPEREDDVEEIELEPVEPAEGEQTEAGSEEDEHVEGDEPEDDLEITFGDEAAPASRGDNSDLVRHLRSELRTKSEELAAIKRGEITPQPQKVDPGPKPTLESCDYDETKFETELDAFKERKRKADEADAQVTQKAQAVQERFNQKLVTFEANKKALNVKDFDMAEAAVLAGFSQVQQAVVIQAADDAAKLVYALGRRPEKLKGLAAIEDPIEFTKALVKLEGQLKVTQRSRTPPDPDRPLRGSAPISQQTDKVLERLEKEASRTGDRSKVIQHKRKLRTQGRA